jgi:hypothetical protein
VYVEKWIDTEVAKRTPDGVRLLGRLEALEKGETTDPIHTSIAVFLEKETPAVANADYDWIARISDIDHDAILLDIPGAATPEQGVGMMVNADEAVKLKTNAGAIEGESYRDKERRIEAAAKTRFASGTDEYVWVADFSDSQVVIIRNGGNAELFGYKIESGQIVFDTNGTAVERRESWIVKIPFVNQLLQLLKSDVKSQQQNPVVNTIMEGDMPITEQERADIVKDLSASFKEILTPVVNTLDTLKASHEKLSSDLTANSRAAETEKRAAVEKQYGKVVADALTGNALDEMFKSLGKTEPLSVNGALSGDKPATGAPDPATYKGA